MKYEWKKEEKQIYMPKENPVIVNVPKYRCFTIEGKGDPNGDDFASREEILYRLSYSIKMMPKRGFIPGGYFEYAMYPLQVVWNGGKAGKDNLSYTLMIRQPEFVTESVARMTVTNILSTNPHPLVNEVSFKTIEDGLWVQVMHIGTGSGEAESLKKLKDFAVTENLKIKEDTYTKIYISDVKRTAPEKLKTVFRYMVEKCD